jgi:hypothetical protein
MIQVTHIIAAAGGTAAVNCNNADGTTCDTGLPAVTPSSNTIPTVIGIAFGIIGIVSVIMVVIGGLRFITAQGDPSGVAKARQTIIYSVIGLAVAVSAEAIVAFVLNQVNF